LRERKSKNKNKIFFQMKTYAEHADGKTFDVWIRAAVDIGGSTLFGI